MRTWCPRGIHLWTAAAIGLTGSGVLAAEVDGLFDQMDKSGDGVVTSDEVGEDRQRFFERLLRVSDTDKDGKLTRDEYTAALAPEETPGIGERGMRGAAGPSGGRPGMASPEDLMQDLDANGDGKLTRDEVADRGRMLVGIMDRLDKEELTLQDLTAMRERMAQMRPGGRTAGPAADDVAERLSRMKALDTNSDGKVSRDEIPEEAVERLRPMLERMGGEIDLAEVDGYMRRMTVRGSDSDRGLGGTGSPRPRMMRLLDSDNDGRLGKLEAVALIEKFSEFDTNGDGGLDMTELFGPLPEGRSGPPRGGAMSDRREDAGRPGDGEQKVDARPEGQRPAAGDRDRNSVFGRMDKDGDGVLTEEEMPSFLKPRFGQLDKDGDGVVTRDEMRRPGRGD